MEQQDPESLAVTELDFSISNFTLKENFRVGFKASELKRVQRECSVSTKGVKPLEDSRVILADAKVAQALHEEEGQVILRFLYDTLGITRVAFQGTLLKDNGPGRHMICLVRDEDSGNHGYWQKTCYSPTHAFESGIPTLCLDRKSLSQGCDDS